MLHAKSIAQNFNSKYHWKKVKKEIYIKAGASGFLGELGGLNKIGTHYSPVDYDFETTKTAIGLGYKYKIQKWLNILTEFNWLVVQGDDKNTKEKFRHERNLNFRSNIFETVLKIEFAYFFDKISHRYSIKNTFSRRMKDIQREITFFAGIGGFYFNPYGFDGKQWIALKPLCTEGEGLPNGPPPYSNYSICIPIGIAYNIYIKKKWSIGIEINWRKTFTDYIDDVSTRYYNPAVLAATFGPKSAQMSDPSLGTIPGFSKPAADGTPAKRGDPTQKDSYFSVQLKLGYIVHNKKNRYRLKRKF